MTEEVVQDQSHLDLAHVTEYVQNVGKKYGIFIVSKGRVNNLRTYDTSLPDFVRSQVTIICPPEEVEAHEAKGRKAHGFEHQNVWQSYAYIVHELAPKLGYEKVIVMDDDVKFFRRENPDAWNLRKFYEDGSDFYAMFHRMDELCDDDAPLVGLHARQMSNVKFPLTVEVACRQTMIHMINVPTFIEQDIRHDAMEFKGDFYVTLRLLTGGRLNKVLVDFTVDQFGASNAPGGVSTYRSLEGLEASAYKLQSLFPDYVSLQPKGNIWPGFERAHLDVRVAWKKAYENGYFQRHGKWPEGFVRPAKADNSNLFATGPKPEGFL